MSDFPTCRPGRGLMCVGVHFSVRVLKRDDILPARVDSMRGDKPAAGQARRAGYAVRPRGTHFVNDCPVRRSLKSFVAMLSFCTASYQANAWPRYRSQSLPDRLNTRNTRASCGDNQMGAYIRWYEGCHSKALGPDHGWKPLRCQRSVAQDTRTRGHCSPQEISGGAARSHLGVHMP